MPISCGFVDRSCSMQRRHENDFGALPFALIAMSRIISGVVISNLNQSTSRTQKGRLAEASANRMPKPSKAMSIFIVIALTALLTLGAGALAKRTEPQSTADPLEQGFKQPLDSAKPRTWWHWTASNVTKEGITRDLEWMKRVGIAGFQLADHID